MRLLYASHDGQTLKISNYIAAKLAAMGINVLPEDLAATPAAVDVLSGRELVVVVAAVRYGHHLEAADRFLAAYSQLRSKTPLVVVSVNLVARKAEKKTPQTNAYLRRWLQQRRVKPVYAVALAGMLDYPRYRWFDRAMIRLIMFMTGGPTDPKARVEFTSWEEVDAVAAKIAAVQSAIR